MHHNNILFVPFFLIQEVSLAALLLVPIDMIFVLFHRENNTWSQFQVVKRNVDNLPALYAEEKENLNKFFLSL